MHIINASFNDINAMDAIPYKIGAYYIFDREYVDFTRLFKITQLELFFVISYKKNLKF